MPMIPALRTPDERFADLPGFPYAANYVDALPGYEALRVHYVDEGPRDAEHLFLCLHGEPTWSCLYRRMIPAILESGGRVIAPDLLGFGKTFMAVGDKDASFGTNSMLALRRRIRGCPEPLVVKEAGDFLQEWGEPVIRAALRSFGDASPAGSAATHATSLNQAAS